MQKLSELSNKEKAGDQPLKGSYRVVLDLELDASNKTTLDSLTKSLTEATEIDSLTIEKYTADYDLSTGDAVELSANYNCTKEVYMDTHGNLIISDYPTAGAVEKIGAYEISLKQGTIAEVNKTSEEEVVEILFTGASVVVPGLEKVAYLGILNLPCGLIAKHPDA